MRGWTNRLTTRDPGQNVKIDSRGNRKNGRFLGRENNLSARSLRLILIDRIFCEKKKHAKIMNFRYQQRHDNRIIANEAKTAKFLRGSMYVCVCFVCTCVWLYG